MVSALVFSDGYKLKKHTTEIIPKDVLFEEILIRLPVKPLTAYKSVCKTWLHTIESTSFRDAHRRHHIRYSSDQIQFSPFQGVLDLVTKSSLLVPCTHSFVPGLVTMTPRALDVMLPPEMTQINWPDLETGEPDFVDWFRRHKEYKHEPHEPWIPSAMVLGPIRTTGIYCIVASVRLGLFPSIFSSKISICNPATRDYKLANPFPPEETARLTSKYYFGVPYGFGLAANGDYKVVVILICAPIWTNFLSYVYSMKQGSWKKLVDSENGMVSRIDLRGKTDYPAAYAHDNLCPHVFLNSCWHWMSIGPDFVCNVLSFNVDDEKFKLVRGPPSYREKVLTGGKLATKCLVSVLNDHLVALYHTFVHMGVISVWMMMEYGDEESWINIWKVNIECRPVKTLVGISHSLTLREEGNGGVHIDRILFQDHDGQLVSCDESGAVVKQPGFDTYSCIFWNNLGISAYSETLERL